MLKRNKQTIVVNNNAKSGNAVLNSIILLFSIFALSCSVKPEPIAYGTDACTYCKMTIMDKSFGAELVTSKGKTAKFDATECMVNYLKEDSSGTYAKVLVVDYATPAALIDASTATFLISPEIPSPMGKFISAYANKQDAQDNKAKKGGDVYDWAQINKQLNNTNF